MVQQSLQPPRVSCDDSSILVLPKRLLRKTSQLDRPLEARVPSTKLLRHERQRLRRRHSHNRCLEKRRRPGSRPHRASPAPDRTASHYARRNSRHGSREYEARTNSRPRRKLPHAPHFRLSSSRRLFPHSNRIPPPDDSSGIPNGDRARQRLRPHLVRLGIREKCSAEAGLRHAPHSQEAGLLLGNARRWLARQLRRLAARSQKVPQRRRRHESPGRPHPSRRIPRPTLVVPAKRSPRLKAIKRSSRLCPAESRRHASQDFLVELRLSLPRRQKRGRVPQSVSKKNPGRLGIRRPQARRPAHERRPRMLQPRSPSREARRLSRSPPGFLPRTLRNRAQRKARRAGRILPLPHRLFLLHHAALQHVSSFRPRKFLPDSFQRQNPESADG